MLNTLGEMLVVIFDHNKGYDHITMKLYWTYSSFYSKGSLWNKHSVHKELCSLDK